MLEFVCHLDIYIYMFLVLIGIMAFLRVVELVVCQPVQQAVQVDVRL